MANGRLSECPIVHMLNCVIKEIQRGKNMKNNEQKDKPKRTAIYYISDCAGAGLACRI